MHNVVGGLSDFHVFSDVWAEIIKSHQEISGDVGIGRLNSVNDTLSQIKDGIFIGLDRSRRVYDKSQGWIDDYS